MCDVCKFKVDATRKELKIHMKSQSHLRAVEAQKLKEEKKNAYLRKEARQDELNGMLHEQVKKYERQVYATLGPIYNEPAIRPTNGLSESVLALYEDTRPRPHIVQRRKALYKFVYRACKAVFPECMLDVYGSIPHRLDSESSDIDMSMSKISGLEDGHALARIAAAIEACQCEMLKLDRVLHARIPLISISDTLANVRLDLSIDNIDKRHISTIFAAYFEMDARIRPLVFAVRCWAKKRAICDSYSGTVNAFGWTVAIVCFLLQRQLVPLVDVDADYDVEHFVPADGGATTLAQLLVGFLRWFYDFDWKAQRMSMRHGGVAPKEANLFEDTTFVCIERPRTPWQNIIRQVTPDSWRKVRAEVARALKVLENDDCISILQIV